jgi:hypothetical protein
VSGLSFHWPLFSSLSQTGHISSKIPLEYITASIVVILGFYTLDFTTSFVHQFDLHKGVTILLVVDIMMAVYANQEVFNRNHQKRQHPHIAVADGAVGTHISMGA